MKTYGVFLAFALVALLAAAAIYKYRPEPYLEIEAPREGKLTIATSTHGSLRIPIFIYHSVHPAHPGETKAQVRFNVTPDEFDQQLAYLKDNGYTPISLDEMIADLKTGTTTAPKPVVLTFDDGWQSQYAHAFLLLKKYRMTATFYVFTNPIGRDARFMTWDEIRDLNSAGMTIGSHTLTHPYLHKLTANALHHELFDSKSILESHIGKPVVHFASPFGYTSDAIQALIKEAGYSTGRTTYKGASHTKDDIYRLTGYYAPQTLHEFIWILKAAP